MTVKPGQIDSQGHIKLDMRVSDKQGEDLTAEITESVATTQRFILSPLPDILIVTQKQFVSLQPYTQKMYQTEDRMYVTPLNAMEVMIDRQVDMVDEVENTIVETEKLKQTRDDTDVTEVTT